MKIYDPFKSFSFNTKTCFLSGEPLESADEVLQVIPTWLMQQYDLAFRPIQMLDERVSTYKDLQVPCSTAVGEKIEQLESRVRPALESGYDAVKNLSQLDLFQWVGKLVYGMVYNEIQAGIRQQAAVGEPMNFSHVLAHKFKNLHLMLQSLILPMEFDGVLPFRIDVFRVDNPDNTFTYRDEINTLVFSMRMKDFGIIATLQDNGTNAVYNAEYVEKVGEEVLHPIQFEELCGRFFYSAYLFNRLAEYTIMPTPDTIYIEGMSLSEGPMKPIFDPWQVKVFGQVLENFWKPWELTLFEIIKDPDNPVSFLLDEEGQFRNHQTIDLPKAGN